MHEATGRGPIPWPPSTLLNLAPSGFSHPLECNQSSQKTTTLIKSVKVIDSRSEPLYFTSVGSQSTVKLKFLMMKDMCSCRICAGWSLERIGVKRGNFAQADFELYRCSSCGYAFVANPWLDYETIYSQDYYRGRGADPWVDYISEWEHPAKTVRQYEWRGVLRLVESLRPFSRDARWLDFGAGMGGLVRYVRERRDGLIFGFEPGAGQKLSSGRILYLSESELDRREHSFDVITAIEVLEHAMDPVKVLRRIRSLLKPGGLFFYTTGNAEPHRAALLSWRYFVPEIHISLYEPRTLALALERSGFRPEFPGYLPGHTDIIRFKVLKNLRVRHIGWWQHLVPWPLVARSIEKRLEITAHPIAWAV